MFSIGIAEFLFVINLINIFDIYQNKINLTSTISQEFTINENYCTSKMAIPKIMNLKRVSQDAEFCHRFISFVVWNLKIQFSPPLAHHIMILFFYVIVDIAKI